MSDKNDDQAKKTENKSTEENKVLAQEEKKEVENKKPVTKEDAMIWLKKVIAEIAKKNHIHSANEVLRSVALANSWRFIKDEALKEEVKKIIFAKWHLEGWWDNLPGKSAHKARDIYELEEENKDEEN